MNPEEVLLNCNFNELILSLKLLRDKLISAETPSVQITKKLTTAVSRHFFLLGYNVISEVDIEAVYNSKKHGSYQRTGRLDLLIIAKNKWQLAIEIDRGNKKWSAEKLKQLQLTRANTFGIWIRWKGQIRNVDTSEIILVDLTNEIYRVFMPNKINS